MTRDGAAAGPAGPDAERRLLRERRAREAAELLVSERSRELYLQLEDARELVSLLEENVTLLSVLCDLRELQSGSGALGYRLDSGALWSTPGCDVLLGPLAERSEFLELLPRATVARIEAFEGHARADAERDVLRLHYSVETSDGVQRSIEMAAAVVDVGGVRQILSVHSATDDHRAGPSG